MDSNLFKYQAFVKAVEYGSFTKAGSVLHYSQSGISRMIGDLENEWGLTLLERGRGGVRLTSDGEKLLPYARNLCADYEKLQMQADDLRGVRSGTIRIGTFSSVATHWFPKIFKVFKADYPGIDFELLLGDYAEIETWILEGRVDCGFLSLPVNPEFETVTMAEDPLLAVLPVGHPLAALDAVPLEELCREPFMLVEKSGRADISELLKKNGVTPNVQFTAWDDYAVMSMVENGFGVSILPGLILKRLSYNIAVRPLDVEASRTIVFVLRSKEAASAAVKKFMDYLDLI